MRNFIYFLASFTATILIVIFTSAPANADFGGGGSGGGFSGMTCSYGSGSGSTPLSAMQNHVYNRNSETGHKPFSQPTIVSQQVDSNTSLSFIGKFYDSGALPKYPPRWWEYTGTCTFDEPICSDGYDIVDGVCKKKDLEPPPDIPPPEVPSPDCNVCNAIYNLNLKITDIANTTNNNNYDMRVSINNMQTTINNIDNSINDLSVNQEITNNNITNITNEINNLITNIENNNITNNEILNKVENITNQMNDYSLQLGDIKLAMGDIELALDNTNKLVLGLRPDIDFIKNNLVNGSPEGKDYTAQLNEIIELLKSCEPTAETPCPDDDAIVKKLKDIEDFMKADFVPDTDSTEVEVEDLTDIELDRNLINFGVAQCPPDEPINTMVNGFAFTSAFKHKPLCDFFSMLAPFVKAFGGFSAALILGGGLRRG